MFKSKSFLLSSAALMMFLTLSAPGVQAMEEESRIAKEKQIEKMVRLYPLSDKTSIHLLRAAAMKRDFEALDELMRRIYTDVIAAVAAVDAVENHVRRTISHDQIKEIFSSVVFSHTDFKKRIYAKPGYLMLMLSSFSKDFFQLQYLPDLELELEEEAKKKNPNVLHLRAMMLLSKEDGNKEEKQKNCLDLLSLAANQGCQFSAFFLARVYQDHQTDALKWYMLSGKFLLNNSQYTNIRRQLQRNWAFKATAEVIVPPRSFKDLQTALTEAKCEHEFRARLHSPEVGLEESQFAIPGFTEDYKRLADYELYFHQVLESLSKTKPGFMITAVSPTAAFREKMDHYGTDQFFSLTTFDDEEYLTVGVENCILVKLLNQINEEMEEALWLLQTIKKPYEILLNKYFEAQAEQLSFGYRNRDLSKAFNEAKTDEEKTQIKVKQVMLKAEFDEKTKGFHLLDKQKVRQDIMRFEREEETLKETSKFIKEYPKEGLGARNKEFLEAYPFWE